MPAGSHAIVNGHFRLPEPVRLPGGGPLLGLVGGTAEWLFVRERMVSLTVSAADALADQPGEAIAARLWADTASALGLPAAPQPPGRIVKERRATFAQTPAAVGAAAAARRPPGPICCSPATGPRPGCRPRSRARSARAGAPPTSPERGSVAGASVNRMVTMLG